MHVARSVSRFIIDVKRESSRHTRDIDAVERPNYAAGSRDDVEGIAQRRHEGAIDVDVEEAIELRGAGHAEPVVLIKERASQLKLRQAGACLLIVFERGSANRVETRRA